MLHETLLTDDIWGEAFCGAMLPDLRRVINGFLVFVPWFDSEDAQSLSPEISVLNKQTVTLRELQINRYWWTAALSACCINELSWPAWRIDVNTPLDGGLFFVGIAQRLDSTKDRSPATPAVNWMGLKSNGQLIVNGHLVDNEPLIINGHTRERADFRCDLVKGLIEVRWGGPENSWKKILSDVPVADLGTYRPYVEFLHVGSRATFYPLCPQTDS